MGWIDHWDLALLLIAAYVAVMTIVRLMARRRDQDIADVEQQLAAHRKHSKLKRGGSKGRDAA